MKGNADITVAYGRKRIMPAVPHASSSATECQKCDIDISVEDNCAMRLPNPGLIILMQPHAAVKDAWISILLTLDIFMVKQDGKADADELR